MSRKERREKRALAISQAVTALQPRDEVALDLNFPHVVMTDANGDVVVRDFDVLLGANVVAQGSSLSAEELAALRVDRTADPYRCPRCNASPTPRGFDIARDRCNACGFVGKRAPGAV